jgi:molybdopterin-binding protein
MQQSLFRNASTWENVATGLRFRHLRRAEIRRRVDEWLERLGVSALAKQNARALSGGEAQRANLARALVLEPSLLLLDEPFNALDTPTKLALMDDLFEILRRTSTTTVFVTHDRVEAQALGERLAVLIDGRLRQIGTPNEVFSMPAGEDVASVVGVENVLVGTVRGTSQGLTTVSVAGRDVTVVGVYPAGDQLVMGLRPEVIVLAPMPHNGVHTSARNSVMGHIVRITPMGAQARVVVDCGFPLVSLITQGSVSELGLEQGMSVRATFKASAAHTIRRVRAA